MSRDINRRQFFMKSALGGAALAAGTHLYAQGASPNEQVVIGVIGTNRGLALAKNYASSPLCRIKYLCDVEETRLRGAVADIEKSFGYQPEGVGDFRQILDDPEVDAVVMALPVHWHAPLSILACKAGKDVYVEKPCCHNPREGELLVEAARKYGRVVQMGNQRRSSPVIREGIERLHNGEIGRVYYVRSWYSAMRESIGKGVPAAVPETLNYDLWQGPAPRKPYKDNLIPYNWHWHWHWGTGELGNNGTHMLDIARWGLQVDYPTGVTAAGGRYRFDDDQETPDTLVVNYDFAEGKTIMWEGLSCNVPGMSGGLGVTFHGENGSMTIGNRDYTLCDRSGKVLDQKEGPLGDEQHRDNFLAAVRANNATSLNAEIEDAFRSTLLSHLGNIAYRTESRLRCGEKGLILDNDAAAALWQRSYEAGWEPQV
jgi:predicted dehydrogenase